MAEGEDGFSQLSRDALVCLATEQNEKLNELLSHFRQLQEDNEELRRSGSAPASPSSAQAVADSGETQDQLVKDLQAQLRGKDQQIADMEVKIAALVVKTRELLDDYCRLQKQQEGKPMQRQDTSTRERGIALAPIEAERMALRAENERLQAQLETATRGATHAAADTAEVSMLRERVKQLETTVRTLRQKLHDTEVRARAAEAVVAGTAEGDSNQPSTSASPPPPDSHQDPTKLTHKQVAGLAAAVVGGGKQWASPTKKSLNLEGYLQKQGGGWGPFKAHFKERYFELRGAQGTLYYSAKRGAVQLGEIPLEQTTVAEATIRPHSFCLLGPKLQRTYILAAASNEERQKWMDGITHAAQHYTKFLGATETSTTEEKQSPLAGSTCINSIIDDVAEASCVYNSTFAASSSSSCPPSQTPTLSDFELLVVVGVGSFGKVLKVRHKKDRQIYAMKVLQKDMIVKHHMVPHTKAEKEILEASNHPFVVKMHYAFQTRKQLVFILDFLTGGELFFHLVNEHQFTEERARFYAAEIALALEHLHKRHIIYRDLKPENLVLDGDGHVCLTDFGLAKTEVTDLTHTFCGTPQYMAPELILKQGHGRAADWWSLGVFLFEMIAGVAPFPNNGNVRELYEMIVSRPPPFPPWMSEDAKSCIGKMLAKEPAHRIQSAEALFATPFFRDLDPQLVEQKKLPVPFKPQHKGDDTRYVDAGFKKEKIDVGPNPTDSKENATIVFDDFTFVRNAV